MSDKMMFRTIIEPSPWREPIGYDSHILCLGSCFAHNIARHLAHSKFNVVDSPTGILFNPASIAHSMEMMAGGVNIECTSLIKSGGRYLSYDFHSSISGTTAEEAAEKMEEALRRGGEALRNSDTLIVTLGTAWTYRLRATDGVVANCHKQPATLFERRMLTVDEAVESLERIVTLAPRRVLFTLSPIRHLGEGLEDNSLSKSLLRVAIDVVCRRYPERILYFPSYEIMMDDLRDYRFYEADMLHPSAIAIEYITEKFYDVALSSEAKALKTKVDKIMRAVEHRPFDPHGSAYHDFCQQQLEAIAKLKGVDLSKEKEYFEGVLQINL